MKFKVYVDNEDLKLKPGMTANVSIITQKKEDVLCVPTIAFKYTPMKKGEIQRYEHQGVWILNGRKPERIEVQRKNLRFTLLPYRCDSLLCGS